MAQAPGQILDLTTVTQDGTYYAPVQKVLDFDRRMIPQTYSASLDALAGLTPAANKLPYFSAATPAMALADFTAAGRTLVGGADAAAMRVTLGLPAVRTPDAINLVATGGGGTSNLTLAAGSGFPGIESWPLTVTAAGTCWVDYLLVDRTGLLLESGWGRINPSTRVLTRSKIYTTGSGASTVSLNGAAVNAPVGAEVQFFLFEPANSRLWAGYQTGMGGQDGLGIPSPAISYIAKAAIAANTHYYVPYPWPGGWMTALGVWVETAIASTSCQWGVFEASATTSGPGSVLFSSNSTSVFVYINTTTTAGSIATFSKFVPKQLLWIDLINGSTPTLAVSQHGNPGPWGTASGFPMTNARAAAGTYGADIIPATAPTSFVGNYFSSNGPVPYLRIG